MRIKLPLVIFIPSTTLTQRQLFRKTFRYPALRERRRDGTS
nr:MAG TPA: hypothetical protein [Bacteriophage sp.]